MAKRDQKEGENTSAATHKSRRQAVKTLLAGGESSPRRSFCNPHTQTRPLISHVVGGSRENAELYRRVGRRIMERGDDAAADGASR
jgi:hypothetical protein